MTKSAKKCNNKSGKKCKKVQEKIWQKVQESEKKIWQEVQESASKNLARGTRMCFEQLNIEPPGKKIK